jgi:hypothetical protein
VDLEGEQSRGQKEQVQLISKMRSVLKDYIQNRYFDYLFSFVGLLSLWIFAEADFACL